MLRLERVSKFYSAGGLVSAGFSKVDLQFQLGEFVAITGSEYFRYTGKDRMAKALHVYALL